MRFVKVFRGGGCMVCVRRAVAVEVESPPPMLYAVEEPYRRIVEEVAAYVAERGTLEKEKYSELYRRFREQYPLPSQLIQQAINQGVEIGKSFLELKRDGRVHKPRPEVRRVSMRFAKDGWSYRKTAASAAQSKSLYPSPAGGERFGSSPTGGSGSTGGKFFVKKPSLSPRWWSELNLHHRLVRDIQPLCHLLVVYLGY
jgi:hypothetical protein